MTIIDLPFSKPVLNAAGSLGFNPELRRLDLEGLGGFITNPVSLSPRSPASGTRMIRFAGGLLLHTGYPNPGLHKVLNRFKASWARSEIPIVVHLLAENPDDVYSMVRTLEETEGVDALEIGFPIGADGEFTRMVLQAAIGELPLMARVGLEDIPLLIDEVVDGGASALSMGPPRGRIPDREGNIVSGRLAGAAIFPQALEVLDLVRSSGIPIFFSGGIQDHRQIKLVLASGAEGVQIDLPLWRWGRFIAPEESSSGRR